MTDTSFETGGAPAPQDRPESVARHVARLEAENAALRRALADARARAERAAVRHGTELASEGRKRADQAAAARDASAEAEARHDRETAAGRADIAAAEDANGALRRANADLAASRATLREREERLRLILDSATDYAILATGLDRRVTSWNAGAERLLGWAEEEIVGRSADVIFTPEDREAGAPEREAGGALRDGRAVNERWHARKDGTRFWGSGLVMPLRDPAAGPGAPPLGLLKVMRDRTAERRSEDALREAADHLRHTVELNPQIPWTADPQGRITGFSARWLAVTGLSREDALGEGWMRVPHPDDRARMAEAWVRAVSTGEPYDVEARLRLADGSYRWWRARASPRRDATGAIVCWYGTTEDIHDRRAAEEARREGERRLRLLANTAAGLLAADDPEGVLRPVFRALSEEFGVDVSFSYVADGEEGGGLRLASCFGVPDEARAGFALLAPGEGVCGRAARDRRPVQVADADTSSDPDAPALRALGVRAYAAFPLCTGDRLLGTLSFGSRERARFSEDDLSFLGAIAHHVAVVRERLRAEAALRGSEARWRGLFETMREGVAVCEMVYDAEGRAADYRHLALNAAWGRLTGVPNERVQGKLVSEAIPGIEPYWLETYARVVETGEPAHFEYHLAVYGRWFEVTAYRTEPGRFAAVFLNVTERRRAEARRDALVELGDRLRDLRDPGAIAHAAAEVIGKALGASRAGYARVDADEDGIRVGRDWTSGPEVAGIAGSHRLSDYWTGLLDGLRRGGVVAIGDVARHPQTAPHLASFAALGVRSCVHAPVVEAGRLAALLYVHAAEARGWTAEEVAFVRGAADRAWAAAERARAEAALRAHAARQAFRLAFEERLRALADPDAIMGEAVALLGRHLGADRVGYSEIVGDAVVRAAGSYAANGIAPLNEDFPIGVFGEAMVARQRRGVTEVSDDVLADPERADDVWAAIDTRSVVSVPLVRGGRFRASLYVNNRAPRRWSREDVALIEEVAARTWDAVARARAEAALRESERRLRATQDHAGVGIVEIDAQGRYVRVNETYTRLSGWTAADLAGRAYWDLVEDEGDREHARRDFGRLVRGEVDRLAAQREYTSKDGRRWWAEITATAIRGAPDAECPEGRFLYAVRVVQDITERKRAEERRALLVNELNHRVKNTLAVVQSLALQTARGAPDLPAFTAAFQARLIALARAHDLLTRESWEGAPLGEVVRAALEPGAGGGAGRVDLGGCAPGAMLAPAQALALAMALHELATNALKHGALSAPGGRVSVACRADPEDGGGARVLEWVERGGPPVAGPPARRGFGLRLLEHGLAAQAGMHAALRFEPGGLRCTLRLPPGCQCSSGAA